MLIVSSCVPASQIKHDDPLPPYVRSIDTIRLQICVYASEEVGQAKQPVDDTSEPVKP